MPQFETKVRYRVTKLLQLNNLPLGGRLVQTFAEMQGDKFHLIRTVENAIGKEALHENAKPMRMKQRMIMFTSKFARLSFLVR